MWRVNVPNDVKVAITRFPRDDADRIFAALRALSIDPLPGGIFSIGGAGYYTVVAGYLVFFDVVEAERVVNMTAVERSQ
jgi:hypothetical protein